MKILGVDTAATECSVALSINGIIEQSDIVSKPRGQAEILMPLIVKVLRKEGVELKELDLIAVTVGPGSFTGLRVGISAARGLAFAAGVRCVGVTVPEVIAQAIPLSFFVNAPVLVALDSRRHSIFCQLFGLHRVPIDGVASIQLAEICSWVGGHVNSKKIYVAGDYVDSVFSQLEEGGWKPIKVEGYKISNALNVAKLSYKKLKSGLQLAEATPLYLREADAVIPNNGGRIRP